ncbi:MAG TPA: flagellar hook-length control protein FliK, partial [Rhodocyclaceae bacterium]|nr:flagellar hook-length control protein FliK [Rhodocyclaceae bacterium]
DTPAPVIKQEVQSMPDELRPLVHQQLEAAGNQRLIWHGEVWPGQQMEWEIEQDKNHQSSSPDEAAPWQTTMRLTTPRLGNVEARLRISGNSLQLNLITPIGATAADLRDELPSLSDALSAAGINLQTAQVRHEPD